MAEPIPVRPAFPQEADFARTKNNLAIVEAAREEQLTVPQSVLDDAFGSVQQTIEDVASKVRLRIRYLASEQPLRLVLGVAVISFLAGIGLRLWRTRYE